MLNTHIQLKSDNPFYFQVHYLQLTKLPDKEKVRILFFKDFHCQFIVFQPFFPLLRRFTTLLFHPFFKSPSIFSEKYRSFLNWSCHTYTTPFFGFIRYKSN